MRYRSLRWPHLPFAHFESCVIKWIYFLIITHSKCFHFSNFVVLVLRLSPLLEYADKVPPIIPLDSLLVCMYNLHSPPLSAASSTSSPPPESADGRKPNILFILADQVSAPLLRIHNDKSPIKTPNIDALASKSVVFSSAYCASPLCAPSRSSLVTGQLPSQIGAWDNASPLGCDAPTYAHYLRREGYETVLAGKMHFIGEQLHGYEERLTSDIYPGDFGWYVQRT